jgi:hypothetical protein
MTMPSIFLRIAIAYHIVLAPIAISQFIMETQGDAIVCCSTPKQLYLIERQWVEALREC